MSFVLFLMVPYPQITMFTVLVIVDSSRNGRKNNPYKAIHKGLLFQFMKNFYVPFLLHKHVRVIMVCAMLISVYINY